MKKIVLASICFILMFFLENAFSISNVQLRLLQLNSICTVNRINVLTTVLSGNGVLINFFGDHISLKLPQNKIFKKNTDQIKNASILNNIGEFLSCYRKNLVRIAFCVSDKKSDSKISQLRQKQTLAIFHYLQNKHTGSPLISAIINEDIPLSVFNGTGLMIDIKRSDE